MMIERQEIYCHDCGLYVHFDIDVSLNGNHVLNCPNCGHEHCRVVDNGRITDVRWDSRNRSLSVYPVSSSTITTSTISVFYTSGTSATTTAGHYLLAQSWLNSAARS